MLFPQFYSFLLVCSFQFCFGCALPSTHFIYCLPGYPRLPIFHWVSNLIYLIFVCILSVPLDICLLIDIVPFLVFGYLCLLGSSDSFWRLFSRVHVFLSLLTFPMGLYLVLGFVGIHFASASRCALTKFSYSSFGVPFSVFSCSVSNLFLNSTTYLSLISLLLGRAQS